MSTGAKVAIGCLVAVALACVIFLVVTFVIGKKASNAMANPDTNTPCGKAAACCTAVYTDLGQAAQAQQACAPIAAMGSMAGSDPNVAAQCTAATAQFTQMISGVPGKTIPAACQ